MEENQGEREPHLGKRRVIGAGICGGKSGLHSESRQVPKRRGRARKENLPRRSRRKQARVKDAKALRKDRESLGFTSSLAKPDGKGSWKTNPR